MGAIDLFWHLSNLFGVSLLFGMVASGGAKMIWRRSLGTVTWRRLTVRITAAAMTITLAGLVAFGRDGRMATYALMVVGAAGVLGWVVLRRRF